MRITSNNDEWQYNNDPSPCPHCGAGADIMTVGLYWDFDEDCWHCIICSCRVYEQLATEAEINAERIWDIVCDDLDNEESSQMIQPYRDESSQDYLLQDFAL
jgi:hypothetical protein